MREHLLRTAERLFASRGVSNVSLREVTRKAGANAALLHYHFGSKVKFYEAVIQRCLKPVNDERLRMLDECEARAGRGGPKLKDIVHAWVAPTLRRESKTREPAMFIRLYGDIVAQVDPAFQKAKVPYSRVAMRRFVSAFERALPDLPHTEVRLRLYFLIGIVRNICTDPLLLAQLTDEKCTFADLNALVDQVVTSAAHVLAAPLRQKAKSRR